MDSLDSLDSQLLQAVRPRARLHARLADRVETVARVQPVVPVETAAYGRLVVPVETAAYGRPVDRRVLALE